jgi:hypothetical protein
VQATSTGAPLHPPRLVAEAAALAVALRPVHPAADGAVAASEAAVDWAAVDAAAAHPIAKAFRPLRLFESWTLMTLCRDPVRL